MNTTEILSIAEAIVPDRTAMIFDGREFTYAQVSQRVNRLANAMAELGVTPGDRISTMQVNSHRSIELYFAAAQLDAVYVPINFRAKTEELHQMLRIADPTCLFIGERYLELLGEEELFGMPQDRVIILDAGTSTGLTSYEQLLRTASPEQLFFPEASDDETTVIMFTSGTTSAPKGVMLTHDSFASYILATVMPADPDIEETNLVTVPYYHIAGLQAALTAVYAGRTQVVMRQFEPVQWMELVQQNKANRAMLVPTMLKQLMDHPRFNEFDLSSLDVITYGAAPMPIEVIREAIKKFPGASFINAFGQTETASTITMLPPEDHVLEGSPKEIEVKLRRLTSIGKPLEDVEVEIVDDDGHSTAVGETGEIVARGPRMMAGYWNEDAATQETLRSGWVYTGDLGYRDEDGYIYLAGRSKDFIKRGGEMVSPEEVERVLVSHPQIDDAAVIGVNDVEWGEEIRAVVVRALSPAPPGSGEGEPATEDDIIEYCRERLAGFKRPRSVVFADELPRNVMGKVLKRDLREMYGDPVQSH